MTYQSLSGKIAVVALLSTLSACATPSALKGYSIAANETVITDRPSSSSGEETRVAPSLTDPAAGQQPPTRRSDVPSIATGADPGAEADAAAPPPFGVETVNAVVPPLPLPDFIDLVFGQMLSTPYVTGPGVAASGEIVQLRSSGVMTADTFLSLVAAALEDYGVRVVPQSGVFQVVQDAALQSRLPRFVRSRARAGTPSGLRPVVQFVELNAIAAEDMSEILRQAFDPREDNLRIEPEGASNYIVLSGLPEDVDAALSIIYQMDELRYAGTQVQRYTPVYWSVSTLSREMTRILAAEGWQTSNAENQQKPILLLAVDHSNDLLIFTRTPQARARVNFWLQELDRPARDGNKSQLFVYNVRNLDAAILADTINSVLAIQANSGPQVNAGAARARVAAVAAAASGQPLPDESGGDLGGEGRIVIDPYGNRLIFSGTASEYDQVMPLIESLDQPAAEVLIEVMIAQVTLTDTLRSGVEWVVNNVGGADLGGIISSAGTGLGSGGLDFSIFPGDASVEVNAFAENKQVNVLSTPRLVARSGSSASVQVGTEVPVLSTQRLPTGGFGGSNVDVISSVIYRSTGIILAIEPIVFSNDRIDLNVTQEVSSTLPGVGPVQSPTFNNTSVTTNLSLEDGATAVIGGLIQDNVTEGEQGIPFLKDVPVLGRAFKVEDLSVERTELVILITAYVLRGQSDKRFLAEKFSEEIDRTLAADNLITLRPRKF